MNAAIASVCALSALAGGASAQQTEDGAAKAKPAASEQLDVVVVTAQKRKEDPNKVALSISAIRGDDLTAQHVADFSDLTRALPNISFSGGNGAGAGLSNIEIRGISSSAGSSTVGVYMDDVSMTVGNLYSMGSVEPKFFDTERVEVLRGPQGTLYGASSMGGTIKFISNQPDLKDRELSYYAEGSSTKGGGANYNANVVANLPLIKDELAMRIGIQTGHVGGYITQLSPVTGQVVANNINSADDGELRLAFKWAPTRELTITPSVFYQKVDSHDIDAIYTSLPGNATNKLEREPGVDRLLVPNLTINYNLGFADLTSVSSFFQRNFDRVQDASVYNSQFLPVFLTGAAPAGLADTLNALPSIVDLNNQVRQFSQEVRLTSHAYDPKNGSALTWVAGVYTANLHTNVTENDPIFGVNAAFKAAGVSPSDPAILDGALPSGFPNDNSYFSARHYHDQQHSVFGEMNYHFTPTLNGTMGLRYLHADNALAQNNDLFFASGPHSTNPSLTSTAFTPKFALSWEVDPSNTLYGSAGKGFRLGGGNVYIPSAVCLASGDLQKLGLTEAPGTFGSDSLWSYEFGNKSRFFGNRLSINADAFYVNWKNIQQQVNLPGCGYNYATNVGNATSKGLEIEIKAKPTTGLLLGLSAGYTKAVLSDSTGLTQAGIPGAVEGAEIEGVPKYNSALTAQYNFSAFGYGTFVRGAAHWVGASHGNLDPTNSDYARPAYHTVDASAGVSFDAFDLTVFVKNALNDDTIIQHPSVASVTTGYRVAPRAIGMSISGKY